MGLRFLFLSHHLKPHNKEMKNLSTATEDIDGHAQREGGGHYCTIHTPTDHYTPPPPYAASHTRLISATKSEATRHALKFQRDTEDEKKK